VEGAAVALHSWNGLHLMNWLTDRNNVVPSGALQSWNELHLLNWSTTTDADGRFSWDSAPDGAVNFSVSKLGYNTAFFAASGGDEQTVTLMQRFPLSGNVVDAARRLIRAPLRTGTRANKSEMENQ